MDFAAEPWDYLAASEAIDIEHPIVQSIASELRTGDDIAYARAAFDHVRDRISHPMDTGDTRVTWRASDVLDQGTGLCFAQSHALAALLRAGGVQAGLCYQLCPRFVHGLTAALVDDRWVRLDPRGTDVAFSASEDALAYPADPILPTVHAVPHPTVLKALQGMRTLTVADLPETL
ncbi:transglutaminase family protein [Actinomadura sp. B10D3]|uniref:transglutaminase-like domain-containing protein n=1 Tax=Actinomadura sp. B10D3 TaxID=3153557 RepID=UPI00325F2D2C